jgi:hypothetical protein
MSGEGESTQDAANRINRLVEVEAIDRFLQEKFGSAGPACSEQALYIRDRWRLEATRARAKVEANRRWFYWLRAAGVTAAIIVPALAGVGVAGQASGVVKWLTFAFGLISALCAAFLELFRFGDRWRISRSYYSRLTESAWDFTIDGNFGKFKKDVDVATKLYHQAYESNVLLAAVAPPPDRARTSPR